MVSAETRDGSARRTRRAGLVRSALAVVCVIMAGSAVACADFDAAIDPTGGAPDVLVQNPSFGADVIPILDKRCSMGGCHSFVARQGGLVLTPDAAYEALVNVPAALSPGAVRVRPNRPDESWLVAMIEADDTRRRGFRRMPLASQPLTPNQIGTIVRWIEQGARRD